MLRAGDSVRLEAKVVRVDTPVATVQLADGQAVHIAPRFLRSIETKERKKESHGAVDLSGR